MKARNFREAVEQLIREDGRYAPEAYEFVRDSLDYTVKLLNKPRTGPQRHVTGAELLEGFRQLALKEFGPMALTVLRRWGLNRCEDVGEIVFQLVDKGILGKTEQDRKEDFANVFDFEQEFGAVFLPPSRRRIQHNPDA